MSIFGTITTITTTPRDAAYITVDLEFGTEQTIHGLIVEYR